ncbi:Polyketide synthase PksJ [Staphylococcus epidermidis]|nr:Polyketide synthase PksJ [Staphylococcus epidermidis]
MINSLYYQGDVDKETDLHWFIDRLNAVNFIPDEIVWVHNEIENNEVIPNYAKILNLIRLLSKRYNTKICINLITSQAYDVIGNEDVDPLQATLTGVAFTISQEYKNLYSRQIDISAEQQEYADIIYREIEMESKDVLVAYRGRNRWTRELIRLEKEIIENININTIKYDGVYFITGGTGGIGLTLAEHLAKNNKCKIILMGRTEFSKKIENMNEHEKNVISKIKEIEVLGSEVSIIEGDVSIRKDVQKAIKFIMNVYGQLNGVIHAAGNSDGKLIQSRDTVYETQVCAPKINGLYNLDECLKGINIDFLMLCSSLVSFMESAGQVAYVASNAFLDSFAQKEQKKGNNVISINWDKWKRVGMSANSKEMKEINDLLNIGDGIGIETSEAGEIFQCAIQLSMPQVVISKKNIDLRQQENRKILNTVLNSEGKSNKPSKKIDDEFDIELLNIFNEFSNEELDMEGNFFELGVTSLDLLQICGLIEREYGIEVPIVTLYNHPNIISLSNEIKNNIALKNDPTQTESQNFKNNAAKKRKKSRLSKKGRGNIS